MSYARMVLLVSRGQVCAREQKAEVGLNAELVRDKGRSMDSGMGYSSYRGLWHLEQPDTAWRPIGETDRAESPSRTISGKPGHVWYAPISSW